MEGRSGNFGQGDTRYKYTSQERDVETGLDYFGARYYDQRIGRFLSIDPHGTTYPQFSPYSYAFDNPIRLIDPTGMDPAVNGGFNGNIVLEGVTVYAYGSTSSSDAPAGPSTGQIIVEATAEVSWLVAERADEATIASIMAAGFTEGTSLEAAAAMAYTSLGARGLNLLARLDLYYQYGTGDGTRLFKDLGFYIGSVMVGRLASLSIERMLADKVGMSDLSFTTRDGLLKSSSGTRDGLLKSSGLRAAGQLAEFMTGGFIEGMGEKISIDSPDPMAAFSRDKEAFFYKSDATRVHSTIPNQ
ncbi:MAG: RHS repeat-associated core domain-containing protein [Ignavibacteria bacterium]|nr:RHS repeat-associated core domain-containing protein [Ignavibacteria bacterium]MBI3765436.1 RHS repeat-associated core domain-containing protein [Ignavibacteriales bacterium]